MTEIDKGGRPAVVLSDEQVTELKALSSVLTKEQLADYFGVSHVTLIAIEKRQPEVGIAYKQGRSPKLRVILFQKPTAATYQHKCFTLKHKQVGKKQLGSKQLKAVRPVTGIL